MNFKTATDDLFDRISHAKLAEKLHVSVAAIRQARLSRAAVAYREPPKDWQKAVVRLSHERVIRLRKLINTLKGGRS